MPYNIHVAYTTRIVIRMSYIPESQLCHRNFRTSHTFLVQKRNNDHAMRRELVYRMAPRIHEKCNIKKLLQVTIFVVVAIWQETPTHWKGFLRWTLRIKLICLPVAWPFLGPGRVLDLVGHTAPDQFPTQLIRLCCLARLRSNCK